MIVLDRLLTGGIRFVLDRLVDAAEAERNDDTALREALLEAQMRHELGEIDDDALAEIETEVMARMREIRERQMGEASGAPADAKITGAEISMAEEVTWTEADPEPEPAATKTPKTQTPRRQRKGRAKR
jgi:hypothetical protein